MPAKDMARLWRSRPTIGWPSPSALQLICNRLAEKWKCGRMVAHLSLDYRQVAQAAGVLRMALSECSTPDFQAWRQNARAAG